jgi:hypothetical protein
MKTNREEHSWIDEIQLKPRTLDEISKIEEELCDRVWYDRHMVSYDKVETGKTKIILGKDFGSQHYRDSTCGKVVTDEVWARALEAAARVERKYGKEISDLTQTLSGEC